MLIGREGELAALSAAIAERRSLLVSGPAGSGKSALLDEVLSQTAAPIRKRCTVCTVAATPHATWLLLVQALGAADDPEVLNRVEKEAGSVQHLGTWARAQTGLRLRGVLRQATRCREYWICLDAAEALPDGIYRLLQEWIWSRRRPVILLARGSTHRELGRASQLYWHDGLRLTLGPLHVVSAQNLLEQTLARLHLTPLADADFCEFVLERSDRLPGRIVRLCELASDPANQYDGHVKLRKVAVDFALEQLPLLERAIPRA